MNYFAWLGGAGFVLVIVAARIADPYEPRRPRLIQVSSQTPNNAAVTASTSADTPRNPNYGCSSNRGFAPARRGVSLAAGELGAPVGWRP